MCLTTKYASGVSAGTELLALFCVCLVRMKTGMKWLLLGLHSPVKRRVAFKVEEGCCETAADLVSGLIKCSVWSLAQDINHFCQIIFTNTLQ